MISHEQYIKQAFKRYTENKKRLRELSFDGVRGVDYSKARTNKATPQGNENALIRYLDEKRTIEKQTELVDRVVEYYDIRQRAFGDEKAVIAQTKDQEIIEQSTGKKLFRGSVVTLSEVSLSELIVSGDEYLTSNYSQRHGTQLF